MRKILFICFIFTLFFNSNFAFSQTSNMNISAEQVQECIYKIQQLPEAREMMEAIQKEGPVRIAISNHALARQFGAYWDVDQRVICVNPGFHRSVGQIIGSILFEMHNALNHSKICYYDDLASEGKIDRENYVREIEYIEYLNSKSTAAIAEIGIERGIFPEETRRNKYADFEEHFYYQQYGGHSAWIGKNYDYLAPKAI